MKLYKQIISWSVLLLILSGCNGLSVKPGKEITIDETLPTIELTDAGTFVDMNAIAFEWKNLVDERVEGVYVYKQITSKENSELSHYKTLENRFVTHFLDSKVKPNTSYAYAFKTYSKDAESKMSKIKVVNSLPMMKSVVWIKSIKDMPRSAKIIWRPHSNQIVKEYIIERKTLEDAEWSKLATVKGRLSAEYIDTDLKDEYVYKYRVRVHTYDGMTSLPSEVVQVVTKPLPNSIQNIVATTNLPKKIEIRWMKSTAPDFNRYHLYRSEKSDGSYELIAKLYNNIFIDAIDEDGKEFFYRVSAVEKNGLESVHDKLSIQGITLNKPRTPSMLEATVVDNTILLKWKNIDPRVKSFIVIKKSRLSWMDSNEEEFIGIKTEQFIDTEIGPDKVYGYQVYALDEFDIKSEGSLEVKVKTPSTIANNVKEQQEQEIKKIRKGDIEVQKRVRTKPTNIDANEEVIIPLTDFN